MTSYEFYVHQDGKFQGPVQMHVAKDIGLPMRIGMSDPRGDFEVPSCLSGK